MGPNAAYSSLGVASLLPQKFEPHLYQKENNRGYLNVQMPRAISLISLTPSVLVNIKEMRFSILVLLLSVYVRTSFGGVFEIIDHSGQCLIWSDDNYGCMGYSASLGLLDGDDCSSMLTSIFIPYM